MNHFCVLRLALYDWQLASLRSTPPMLVLYSSTDTGFTTRSCSPRALTRSHTWTLADAAALSNRYRVFTPDARLSETFATSRFTFSGKCVSRSLNLEIAKDLWNSTVGSHCSCEQCHSCQQVICKSNGTEPGVTEYSITQVQNVESQLNNNSLAE